MNSQFDQLFISPAFLLLYDQVSQHLDDKASTWLDNSLIRVNKGEWRSLTTAFSLVPRKLGKESLCPTDTDISRAQSVYSGWTIQHWSVDQAARTLLLQAFPAHEVASYRQAIMLLFDSANLSEQIALYQSLPVLPHSESFCAQAVEGVRSSITSVFEAIALQNPYPEYHFDQAAWNQMVLKALFEGSPLFLIQGIDRRANLELAKMLVAYAHERWSAGRAVSPELWRSVGRFTTGGMVESLRRALSVDDVLQQQAAAIACSQSGVAHGLLDSKPELKERVMSGELNWEKIGRLSVQVV